MCETPIRTLARGRHGAAPNHYRRGNMILSGHQIEMREGMIHPFIANKTTRNGMSFGLSHCGYDVRAARGMVLWPSFLPFSFRLNVTIEKFDMPLNVMAEVKDKSTWARQGLSVFNTVIEPGWRGYLTLELKNQSWMPRIIHAGDPIAQIVFKLVSGDCSGYKGKYQDQPPQPVPAIMEKK